MKVKILVGFVFKQPIYHNHNHTKPINMGINVGIGAKNDSLRRYLVHCLRYFLSPCKRSAAALSVSTSLQKEKRP